MNMSRKVQPRFGKEVIQGKDPKFLSDLVLSMACNPRSADSLYFFQRYDIDVLTKAEINIIDDELKVQFHNKKSKRQSPHGSMKERLCDLRDCVELDCVMSGKPEMKGDRILMVDLGVKITGVDVGKRETVVYVVDDVKLQVDSQRNLEHSSDLSVTSLTDVSTIVSDESPTSSAQQFDVLMNSRVRWDDEIVFEDDENPYDGGDDTEEAFPASCDDDLGPMGDVCFTLDQRRARGDELRPGPAPDCRPERKLSDICNLEVEKILPDVVIRDMWCADEIVEERVVVSSPESALDSNEKSSGSSDDSYVRDDTSGGRSKACSSVRPRFLVQCSLCFKESEKGYFCENEGFRAFTDFRRWNYSMKKWKPYRSDYIFDREVCVCLRCHELMLGDGIAQYYDAYFSSRGECVVVIVSDVGVAAKCGNCVIDFPLAIIPRVIISEFISWIEARNLSSWWDVCDRYNFEESIILCYEGRGSRMAVIDGDVLYMIRDGAKPVDIIGGKLEYGESFSQCVAREVVEELGVAFSGNLLSFTEGDGVISSLFVCEYVDPGHLGMIRYDEDAVCQPWTPRFLSQLMLFSAIS